MILSCQASQSFVVDGNLKTKAYAAILGMKSQSYIAPFLNGQKPQMSKEVLKERDTLNPKPSKPD